MILTNNTELYIDLNIKAEGETKPDEEVKKQDDPDIIRLKQLNKKH